MNNDNELDEILESIKKHKEQRDSFTIEDMPLAPPEPSPIKRAEHRTEATEPKREAIKKPKREKPVKAKKEKTPKPKKDKPEKPKKDKKPKPEKTKKEKTGYGFNLKIAAILVVTIVASILINQGIVYAQIGYLRPYEKQYGIKYPKGISEEFCDAYGQNQDITGKLIIPDLDKEIYVCESYSSNYGYLEIGTDFNSKQQFRAIALNKSLADLEGVYSTADSYEKSSQKIEYKNIYGDTKTYQVFASYYVTTNAEDDNDFLFPYNLYGDLVENDFDNFKDKIATRSLFKTGYNMSYFGSYLTLSVDSDFMESFRFVIICTEVDKVTPITETTANENIHYPQIWYDKNNKHNPYWLASKWQPHIYIDEEHTESAPLEMH